MGLEDDPVIREAGSVVVCIDSANRDSSRLRGRRVVPRIIVVVTSCYNDGDAFVNRALDG